MCVECAETLVGSVCGEFPWIEHVVVAGSMSTGVDMMIYHSYPEGIDIMGSVRAFVDDHIHPSSSFEVKLKEERVESGAGEELRRRYPVEKMMAGDPKPSADERMLLMALKDPERLQQALVALMSKNPKAALATAAHIDNLVRGLQGRAPVDVVDRINKTLADLAEKAHPKS